MGACPRALKACSVYELSCVAGKPCSVLPCGDMCHGHVPVPGSFFHLQVIWDGIPQLGVYMVPYPCVLV